MSTETIYRCGVCRSYLDPEDLFCANCGTESPQANTGAERLSQTTTRFSFECQGCGASMSYDATARALRCPFCGGTDMEQQKNARTIRPDAIIPFSIEQPQAESILRKWLGSGFWRPSDAAQASRIGKIAAVYVPYWVFRCQVSTKWTADSSPAPLGSRGNWYPVSGSNHSRYHSVLVGGSSVLTPQETNAIAPFDASKADPPDKIDLDHAIHESFRVPRKMARPLARGYIEELERSACSRLVPNRSRNVNVNVRISDLYGRPMLLPVWILAYRYKKSIHRVLINGQTGKIAGSAPFSYGKLTLIIVLAIVLITVVLGIVIAAN